MHVDVSGQMAELRSDMGKLLERTGSASTDDDIIYAQKAKQVFILAHVSMLSSLMMFNSCLRLLTTPGLRSLACK